ncbi:MAG: hypothetical protein ACLQVF_14305 [Isosphaeraceae bacterium]
MTCREFERKFNELLDGEGGGKALGRTREASATGPRLVATDLEGALIDHASRCPACREVAAGYQILGRALHAWNSAPVAPADLVDRILLAGSKLDAPAASAWAVVGERKRERLWPIVLALGVAAAAACMIGLVNSWLVRKLHDLPMPPTASVGPADELHSVTSPSGVRLADAHALNDALAEATKATWDLARSASEPAARISRQMLDAATGPEPGPGASAIRGRPAEVSVTMPTLTSLAPDPAAARAMLQEVGDRLASGAKPLSRTARHAFGFLLGPTPAKLEGRNTPPASKGA